MFHLPLILCDNGPIMAIDVNPNIERIQPYIPGKPIEDVQRELGLSRVIKLASNENNIGLPASVQSELSTKISELFLYPDGAVFKLRQVLADRYQLEGSQLIFGNGSDELLLLIALAFLGPDKEALVSEGTFSEYAFSAHVVNAPIKTIPLNDLTYDLNAFALAITPLTRVIFLCNPNNPTGTIFSSSALESFMQKVPANVLVVLDEAYFEFAVGSTAPDGSVYPDGRTLISRYDNLIVLRTFSKMWSLAGCRLGYGMASPAIIEALNKARQPFNINRFAQEAALLMLEQTSWTTEVRSLVDSEKARLMEELSALGLLPIKSYANFIFIDIGQSASKLFEQLLKKGVIIRAMDGFGFPQAIRVTVGLPDENDAFITALKEVL